MAIKISDTEVINDAGKLNSPTLTVVHPTASSTVVDIQERLPPEVIGTTNGFTSGGYSSAPNRLQIEKFPFVGSSVTAVDVGDLVSGHGGVAKVGHSTSTDGFSSGGSGPGAFPGSSVVINKFPFAISSGNATNTGQLNAGLMRTSGQQSNTTAFVSGGVGSSYPLSTNIIQSFPFAINNANLVGSDVGDLISQYWKETAGHSSETDGFASGGREDGTRVGTIQKFPFAISSGTATDVGDLSNTKYSLAGISSPSDAFTAGGNPTSNNTIDKFPFAISSGTATSVGSLTSGRQLMCPHSETSNGFTSGGYGSQSVSSIEKFPFAITSGNATLVGSLLAAMYDGAGHSD